MKKLLALFLCAVMALSMACATAETAPEAVSYTHLQIRKLEDELGVALFIRNPRGVEATAYADMLAKKVPCCSHLLHCTCCKLCTT